MKIRIKTIKIHKKHPLHQYLLNWLTNIIIYDHLTFRTVEIPVVAEKFSENLVGNSPSSGILVVNCENQAHTKRI
jgi:hypothetical protein